MTKFIFVGNPGTGKSTLLNGIFGEAQFLSGNSVGKGLTVELQWADHSNGDSFADTPGLADVELRKEAAEAITTALKSGEDDYKIIFVITEEGARVRPMDVQTITTVLSSVQNIDKTPPYGIIVNKVTKKVQKKICDSMDVFLNSVTPSINGDRLVPQKLYFVRRDEDLEDEANKAWDVDENFLNFLNEEIDAIKLVPDKVLEVTTDDYDSKVEGIETMLREMQANNEVLKRSLNDLERASMEQNRNPLDSLGVFGHIADAATGGILGKGLKVFGL